MLRSYQYQFDLDLDRVHLEIPFACAVELWWRKGNKKITTKRRIELTGRQRWFDVGERLSMIATCHCDGVGFVGKPSIINVVIVTANNPNKSGGYHSLELTDVLKVTDPLNPVSRSYDVSIQNCPTANGRMQFGLSAKCLHEVMPNQSFTVESGGLNTPTRNQSVDMTFRAEELDGHILASGGGLAELDFSFQQTPFHKNRVQVQQQFVGNLTMPTVLPSSRPADNETFYQLLETKRKLDERNMQFAKLHNDFILQMEKLRHAETESKHREVRMMNEVNMLNEQVVRLKKQLTDQATVSSQHALVVARSKEQLKKAEVASHKLDQLQSEVYRKQAELICIENTMSNRLKEAVANNEKLTETISGLNSETRSQYQRLRELERQKLQLQTQSLREKEAGDLKIRVLEEKAKEKDAIIDIVRKDFEKFSIEKVEMLKRLKEAEQTNKCLSQQLSISNKELQLVRQQQRVRLTQQSTLVEEIKAQKDKLKAEHDYVVEEMLKRIKALEQVLESKSIALSEKQQLMDKAKDYVNFKEEEIQRRDQFIARAKQYLQDKEAEMNTLKAQLTKHEQTISGLRTIASDRQQKLKQLQLRLDSTKSQSSTVLTEMRSEKQASAKRQQQLSLQLQRQKEQTEQLRAEINAKSAYCLQVQFEGQQTLLKVNELELRLQNKERQLFCLQEQLQVNETDNESLSEQMQQRMQETMKQNAQYLVQINIYSREVKNMQELLQRAEKKLMKLEERERSRTLADQNSQGSRQPLKENSLADHTLQRSKYASFVGEDSAPNSRVA